MLLAMVLSCAAMVSMVTALPTGTAAGGDSPYTLDFRQIEEMGIDPQDLLHHLKQLAEGNYICGLRETSDMKRHFISNRTVTCNDGSPAGYYLRKSGGSNRWIVFLEGGWFCFDKPSCQGRWVNTPHLMSSEHWPDRRKGTGILSWDPEENPYLYNANLVHVPYCSSDTWSGTYKAHIRGDFSFMGALIIEEVIKDLIDNHELGSASLMYFGGSSAGGTGVLLNLDLVAGLMSLKAPRVEVRGISDSGWFLDNKQYKSIVCSDAHSCAPTEGVQRGITLWQGRVPEACRARYPSSEQWKCYFGYRIYPTLKTPVFVIQHLFDEAQITADNVGPPVRKEQWQYIHDMGQDIKQTIMNVSAVFAPACLSHILLTRSEWHRVSIHGVTLPEALKCWEDGKHERNLYQRPQKSHAYDDLAYRLITGESLRRRDRLQGDDPVRRCRKHRKGKRCRKRRRKKPRKDKQDRDEEKQSGSKSESRRRHTRQREEERNRRSRRSAIFFDLHDLHHVEYHENQCSHHRIDYCAWPQCNFSCPKIHNPFTGDEMDFIDLLMQFGLDLSSIASALGMDLPTLQSMDHDKLLRLLIQHSR